MSAETTAPEGTTELTPYGIAMDALERIVDTIDEGLGILVIRKIASDGYRSAVLRWQGRPDAGEPEQSTPVTRYALVEQMGHRSTVGSVRETVFCGRPMLAVTNLRTGAEHLVSPDSLYEITWLTEDEARSRANPWTAAAITAGAQEDSDPWLGDEDDEASYQARRAAEADL